MSNEPKISVVSACYNHGRFVNEMIESVLRQTFKDWELIIVNDGSTDDTKAILQTIFHEKIKIIHTENFGPANARNTAIEHAKAPIIMNLDADDMIAPDLLEKAYRIFSCNSNAGIVYSDAVYFGAKPGKFDVGEYTMDNMLFDNRIISLGFFRKEGWHSAGGYSSELIFGLEDWDFWLSIIETGCKVIKIPEPLVKYRTYKDPSKSRSGRRKSDRLKMMESLITIFHRHEKLYSTCPEAYKYFSNLEEKFRNENKFARILKNYIYRIKEKYYYNRR